MIPLLQSVYAETLRLHVASFLASDRKDFDLNGWRIPRDAPILVSGFDAQMDPDVWTPNDEPHCRPVHEFWLEGFLGASTAESKGTAPEFLFKGLGNSWLPYEGGNNMCPRRHLAKQEMRSSLALVLTLFDIEIVDPKGKIPDNNLVGCGYGALWPKQPMPVRVRRRQACYQIVLHKSSQSLHQYDPMRLEFRFDEIRGKDSALKVHMASFFFGIYTADDSRHIFHTVALIQKPIDCDKIGDPRKTVPHLC